MLGDEAARIGLVAAHRIAQAPQGLLDRFGDRRDATRPVAVAEHHVGARALVLGAGGRRHGVAVDQDGRPEIAVNAREQAPQHPMVGFIESLDAPNGIVDRDALTVNLLGIADYARHGSKPPGDSHGSGVGEGREPALEHPGVELIGFAVHIHVAAWKVGTHHGVATSHHASHELVDEGVLRASQSSEIEPGSDQASAHPATTPWWRPRSP